MPWKRGQDNPQPSPKGRISSAYPLMGAVQRLDVGGLVLILVLA
jgi:hypothetical protein